MKMKKDLKEWTHKSIKFEDVRKLEKLYAIKIKDIDMPLFVSKGIFEKRLQSYFLCPMNKISREDVMNLNWNMHITKGYYIKIMDGEVDVKDENTDPDKYYVSFLEIDGPLGGFESVLR